MSLREEQSEFFKDIALFFIYLSDIDGLDVTLGEAYRTKYQQREYVRNGLSMTQNSFHLKRLAVDLNFFLDGKYINRSKDHDIIKHIADVWEGISPQNRAGYYFKGFVDFGHFERRIG